MELLPELLARCISQSQNIQGGSASISDRANERRNFLHPESAAILPAIQNSSSISNTNNNNNSVQCMSPMLTHSRSVPPTSASTPYNWPASPILPPISSRTPHLVPEPLQPQPNS